MKLALALLLLLVFAVPAAAAGTVVHRFGPEGLEDLDSYGDRVAWTESVERSDEANALWTLERGVAIKVNIKPVLSMDVAAGPKGRPVAVYNRCAGSRCTFFLYDFKTRRESRLKGAPTGGYSNWRFWRDRFALIRNGRFVVVGLDGSKPKDVGRARSLASQSIDFNGQALSYVNLYEPEADYFEYDLAYFPVVGKGKILKVATHGASGELSLGDARVDETNAYATQIAGEFGGPNRLWRVNIKTGKQQYAGLPRTVGSAVHVGDKQALVHFCRDEDEQDCELVLSDVNYRDR